MSQRDAHEALVEKVAFRMVQSCNAPRWSDLLENGRNAWREHARAVLAIVAEAVKEPTAEMIVAFRDDDTPFVWRRTLDKGAYEVIQRINEDWRTLIANDGERVLFTGSPSDAKEFAEMRQAKWKIAELFAASPLTLGDGG